MTRSIDVVRQVVSWAAGALGEVDAESVDHDMLVHALDAHRLDGRFLRRIAGEPAPWATPDLIAAIRQRHEKTRERVRVQVATARRLALQASPEDQVVLLKGFSLYALTGAPNAMRRSGDLDLIAADLDGFVDRALATGFRRTGELDQLAEYAVLESDADGLVELHSYFPLTYVPGHVPAYHYDPSRHPGRWELREPFVVHKLRHVDLAAHRAEVVPVPLAPLGILAPEMLVLVYAGHLYADYILNLLPLPVGTVRLDEVATICDLVRLPSFRADVFARLVDEYDGQHVVDLARALAQQLLRADPFEGILTRPSTVAFPRDLWWDGVDGFPIDLGFAPEQLVYRDIAMLDVLHRLSANVVELPRGGAAHVGALTGMPWDADRYVYRVASESRFGVECRFSSTDDALCVQVVLPTAQSDEMSGLSLNFGDHRFEFFYKPAGRHFRASDYSNLASTDNGVVSLAETADGRDVFDVTIPWKTLGDPMGGSSVPLLLGCRQQKREWGRMTGGVILPLIFDVTA